MLLTSHLRISSAKSWQKPKKPGLKLHQKLHPFPSAELTGYRKSYLAGQLKDPCHEASIILMRFFQKNCNCTLELLLFYIYPSIFYFHNFIGLHSIGAEQPMSKMGLVQILITEKRFYILHAQSPSWRCRFLAPCAPSAPVPLSAALLLQRNPVCFSLRLPPLSSLLLVGTAERGIGCLVVLPAARGCVLCHNCRK